MLQPNSPHGDKGDAHEELKNNFNKCAAVFQSTKLLALSEVTFHTFHNTNVTGLGMRGPSVWQLMATGMGSGRNFGFIITHLSEWGKVWEGG